MNILPAIRTHLVNQGVTAPIKFERVPDKPDDVIVIRDTGAVEPDANDTTSGARQHKTFQIYLRAKEYATANDLAQQMRAALINRIDLVSDGVSFENILLNAEFQPIGDDAVGRYEFTANFTAWVLDAANAGYMPGAGAEGLTPITLNRLADVSVDAPSAGDALVWNGTTWIAETITAPSGGGDVASVNGQTGVVQLTKADVNLGSVDNTADADKPISTATQTALNAKANSASLATVATTGSYNDLTNKPVIPTGGGGTGGGSGIVEAIVAGDNVTVDATDPANPIVSAVIPAGTGGGGGGASDVVFSQSLKDLSLTTIDIQDLNMDVDEGYQIDFCFRLNWGDSVRMYVNGLDAAFGMTATITRIDPGPLVLENASSPSSNTYINLLGIFGGSPYLQGQINLSGNRSASGSNALPTMVIGTYDDDSGLRYLLNARLTYGDPVTSVQFQSNSGARFMGGYVKVTKMTV